MELPNIKKNHGDLYVTIQRCVVRTPVERNFFGCFDTTREFVARFSDGRWHAQKTIDVSVGGGNGSENIYKQQNWSIYEIRMIH